MPIPLYARQGAKIVGLPWLRHMERLLQDALAARPERDTQRRLQSAALLCRRACREVPPGRAEEDASIYLTDGEVEVLGAALAMLAPPAKPGA